MFSKVTTCTVKKHSINEKINNYLIIWPLAVVTHQHAKNKTRTLCPYQNLENLQVEMMRLLLGYLRFG